MPALTLVQPPRTPCGPSATISRYPLAMLVGYSTMLRRAGFLPKQLFPGSLRVASRTKRRIDSLFDRLRVSRSRNRTPSIPPPPAPILVASCFLLEPGSQSRLPFRLLSVNVSVGNQADPKRARPTVLAAEDGRNMAGRKYYVPEAGNDSILSVNKYFCRKLNALKACKRS